MNLRTYLGCLKLFFPVIKNRCGNGLIFLSLICFILPQSLNAKEVSEIDFLSQDIKSALAQHDFTRAYQLIYIKAQSGDPSAQHQLALMCLTGEGTATDPVEAVKWFREAAKQNHIASQEQLALALLNGNGVGQDEIEASIWLNRADENGSNNATYMLANLYLQGKGIKKDLELAYTLFSKAATLGHTKSMLKQADMLIAGNGVTKNVYQAITIYKNAASAGDRLAKMKLPELESKKFCLFSAKTKLFGKYIKCTKATRLHLHLQSIGIERQSQDEQLTYRYDSSRLLRGSNELVLNFTKDNEIARLMYVFTIQNSRSARSKSINIKRIKKMLVKKYGNKIQQDGILGVGYIQFSWRLEDNVEIILNQKSPSSDIKLEYRVPMKFAMFEKSLMQARDEISQKAIVLDSAAF